MEDRLAACVNLIPGLVSTYRWKGKLHRDAEHLLIIKTAASRFDALCQRLRALHPYELPELIGLPISRGDPDYLRWISESTRP